METNQSITIQDEYECTLNVSQCDMAKISRVEVIDSKGRAYTNWQKGNKVFLSIQDNGQTLKIFITEPEGSTDKLSGMKEAVKNVDPTNFLHKRHHK